MRDYRLYLDDILESCGEISEKNTCPRNTDPKGIG